jgi:hypothetical protein
MPAAHRPDATRTADHLAIIARRKKALQKQPKLDSVAKTTQSKTHQHAALQKAGMMLTMRTATSASCLNSTRRPSCGEVQQQSDSTPDKLLSEFADCLFAVCQQSDCSLLNIPSTTIRPPLKSSGGIPNRILDSKKN